MGFEALKAWARRMRRDAVAVWLAARHPDTPWAVRLLALAVAGYALSPIDLIPDFVPVLGYLDDLLFVPLGIVLVVRLTPAPILADCRARADALLERPRSRIAATVVIATWILAAVLLAWWLRMRLVR